MQYYYKLDQVNQVDFIPYVGNDSHYSGISMTRLTDDNYNYSDGQITFVGYRLKAAAPFKNAKYNETITLQTKHGMLVASQTYDDSGTGFETTLDFVDYVIHTGTGRFKCKNKIRILFNNNNNGHKTRKILVV